MKVFLSWSGSRSKEIALALRELLPDALQSVDPWMSESEISPGSRWTLELDAALQECHFGIVCLTPENLKSPWLLYEAGSLAKVVDASRVVPFLYEVAPADVPFPLAQFQNVTASKAGTLKLFQSINAALPSPLSADRIQRVFDLWWAGFESRLAAIPGVTHETSRARDDSEIFGEMLELVSAPPIRPSLPLVLEVPPTVLAGEERGALLKQLEVVLQRLDRKLGLPLPKFAVQPRSDILEAASDAAWRLLAFDVPIAEGEITTAAPTSRLAEDSFGALRRHAGLFIGIQETSSLMQRAAADYPDVVKEVLRALPLARVAEVIRRLVSEEVSVRNLRDILEALADAAQREKDVFALTELARIALKRQISHQFAKRGQLDAVLLTPELEEMIRQSIRVTSGIQQLRLDPADAVTISDAIQSAIDKRHPDVVLTAVDIRWHVRKLIEAKAFETHVLSYHELVPTLQLKVLERVALPDLIAPTSLGPDKS